jgi:transcription elongation factor Elf1
MQPSSGATAEPRSPNSDIVFACTHCATEFVVETAAAGATLECESCGKPTVVPERSIGASAEDALRVSDLQRQLKENESQRTEVSGYINQLTIQLSRWQLRLQTLNERQKKLQAELAAITNSKS